MGSCPAGEVCRGEIYQHDAEARALSRVNLPVTQDPSEAESVYQAGWLKQQCNNHPAILPSNNDLPRCRQVDHLHGFCYFTGTCTPDMPVALDALNTG